MFGRVADLAVAPSLPGPMSVVDGSGSVVPFTRVRVILQRTNGEELLSRIIDFPASASEVPLSLEFPLPPEAPRDGLPLLLFLRYMNAVGDTVFAGGPVQVIARPRVEGQAPQQVPIALEWVGPGSSAVRVEIAPVSGSALSGTTTTFTAVAYDAQDAIVDGAPIVFSTPDPTRVSFGAPGSGTVTWSFVRGAVRVIASLPSGPSDTASFDVQLPPSQLQVVSGGAQTALVGAALPAPVVLRVTAVDALPVAGVTVNFSVTTGGGSLSAPSAVSDANGDVSVNWTLGALPGVQAIDATFAGLGARVFVTAIAAALPPAGLVFTTQPAAVIAGATMAPVVVEVRDAFNALSTTYAGPVSLLLDAGQSNATLGGTTTVNAVAGIATFAALNVQNAGIWTLTAEIPDLATGGSNEFTVSPAAAATLTLVAGDAQTMNVGLPLTEPLVVRLEDAFGNGIPDEEVSFSVTLGGGSMNVSTAVTDEAGLAVAEWTLGPAVGLHTARATLTGQQTPFVDFTATAVSGGAVRVAVTAEPGSMTAGTTGTFQVVAFDAFDNVDAAFTGGVTVSITDGPGGATLQGTTTRAAVAGIATFDDLRLDVAGSYTLTFASAGLTSGVVEGLVTVAGAAASFTILSGDGQLGLISTLLASPLRVRVADAFGNGVVTTVTFAVASGGGSLGTPSGTTNGAGEAQTTWTLGTLVGAQSVTAATPGLGGLTFTATANPLTGLRTWTGAFNTDWSNALNWENGLVPTSLDTVLVPVTPFPPALVDNVVISGLTIADGASMAVGGSLLTIAGSLVAPVAPSITAEVEGGLGLIGTTGTVRGTLPTLFIVNGAYALSGALLVEGDMSVTNGTLTVDAFPVTVQGNFLTGGTGALAMLPGSVMTVGGDAVFTGGSTAGLLTGGRLNIGGDFVQVGGSPSAFSASPAHETWFVADTEQNVTFAAPAFGAGFSHFGTLYVGQGASGSLRLLSEVFVDGALETGGAPTSTVVGSGQRVVSRGADIGAGGITFDNVVWELLDGAPVAAIPQLRFRNMDPLATQFRVSRAGGAFTIVNAIFETAPTTGYYLNLMDNAADADVLTVTLTNVLPAFHGGRVTLSGGAQLVGWQVEPNFTWTGAVSNAWNTAGNWAGGTVPDAADSVHIPAGTPNAPVLSFPASVRTLTLEPAATLDHQTSILTVAGSLDVPPTATVIGAGGGRVELAVGVGEPGTVRGTLYGLRVNGGNYSLTGDLLITAGLDIYFGDLSVGNLNLTVGTSIYIGQAGTMTMTGTGVVDVFNVGFDGASTAGRLTNGTLRVRGRFEQLVSESDQSFSASGAHVVELIGAATQDVTLLAADSSLTAGCTRSCFATLRALKAPGSGGVRFLTSAKALSELTLQADSINAASFGLVSTGRPVFDSPILRAASIAYRDSLVQNSSARTIDSLIAWGVGTPLATIPGVRTVVTGEPLIRGSHSSRIDVTGTLDVDGWATIAGNLRTLGAGTLRMLEAVDSLNVDSTATFSGGPTADLLTAGVLRVGGNFTQSIGDGAFAAGGTHRTRLYNGCDFCDGLFFNIADTTGTTFGELLVEDGYWSLTGAARASGAVTIAATAVVDNGNNARIRTTGSFTQAPTAGLSLAGLSVGGVLTIPAGAFPVDTLVLTGAGQTLPFYDAGGADISYRSVRVTGTATALIPPSGTPQSMTGNLTVEGTLGFTGTTGSNLTIGGNLTVQGAAARLIKSGTYHRLRVLGNARFDGAAATGDLASGLLTLTGDLVQAATHSPASFAPVSGHMVELVGNGVISFATPAQSSVGILDITAAGVARTLTTDLTATGYLQLDADGGSLASNVLGVGGTRYVTAPEAYVYPNTSFTLRNVALRLGYIDVDGGLVLDDFDPSVVQIDLAAESGGSFAWGFDFRTLPTGAGRYLRVTDTAPADGLNYGISIGSPLSPQFHGGFAEAVAPATISGWEAAPNFRWTGDFTNNWNLAGNWAGNRVPTAADSVYIGTSFANPPAIPANGVTVRAFVSDYLGFMNLNQPLRVTRRFSVPAAADIPCDGGSLELLGDGVTEVAVSGRLLSNCNVRVLTGTTVAVAPFTVGDLQVEGTAIFDVSRETVTVDGNFSTMGGGRLMMMEPSGVLAVVNGATFSGGSTAGLLTDGRINIGGNFSQLGAESSFSASGAHVTRFVGSQVQQAAFGAPGTGAGLSHFGNVELAQQEGGVYVLLNSPAYAEGQLRTDDLASARQLRKGSFGIPEQAALFQSRGADVDAATFFNVRWEIVDGAPIGRMDNVSFTAMDSSATYLTMRRSADDIEINGMQFVSGPEEGAYLRLEDSNGATGLFRVTMLGTGGGGLIGRPPQLNGNIFVIAPAVLLGWP